jgi:hypothetical protein
MKAETLTKIQQNLASIRFGIVAVTFQIHDGRVTAVTHSVTENSRETNALSISKPDGKGTKKAA